MIYCIPKKRSAEELGREESMKYYIGIDLGGMSAKAGLMDECGELRGTVRCATNAADAAEETAASLARLAKRLMAENNVSEEDVGAVGVGSPGVIDSASGTVVFWSNFGWNNVPLGALIRRDLSLPVYVTNDANAAALGEGKYGSGKGYDDSVMITLGTGVGGGIVLGGKLFEGYRSAGGELGHTVIRAGGRKCTCGRRGCLECYASATALKRMTREAMTRDAGKSSLLWKYAPDKNVSGKTAFLAAREGDEAGAAIVKKYISYLGDGIIDLVNLLRPQAVILGGGVSNEGEALFSAVREYVYRYIYAPKEYAPLEIKGASLGADAGIYGACAYAMERAGR